MHVYYFIIVVCLAGGTIKFNCLLLVLMSR